MNIGIRATDSPYVCLCNNDLVFHRGWASAIVSAMNYNPQIVSASPFCPLFHTREGFVQGAAPGEAYFGVLTGWCIFVQRSIFKIIARSMSTWYSGAAMPTIA